MVGVQPKDFEAGHQLGKTVDEPGIGSVPSVDGLIGVADGTQVGLFAQEGADQAELGRVDVLELVDGQVAVAPSGLFGEGGVVEQQVGCVQEDVVEVDEVVDCTPGVVIPGLGWNDAEVLIPVPRPIPNWRL